MWLIVLCCCCTCVVQEFVLFGSSSENLLGSMNDSEEEETVAKVWLHACMHANLIQGDILWIHCLFFSRPSSLHSGC